MGVPIEKKRRNKVSVSWKKAKLEKTNKKEEGVSLGEGTPRNSPPVILIGRGVQGGRVKLFTDVFQKKLFFVSNSTKIVLFLQKVTKRKKR